MSIPSGKVHSPQAAAHTNGPFRGRFAVELARFSRHKEKLLTALVEGHGRGPKLSPFDRDKSWKDLLHLAEFYLGGVDLKKRTGPARGRFKQLTEFADHLGKARGLVLNQAYDHVGFDIFWMWSQEAKRRGLPRGVSDFNALLAILPQLETAARDAASRVRARPGRPRGRPVLPSAEVIVGLASAYRRCTGAKPGAGRGPFARFAKNCLASLGCGGIKDGPLIDAIKGARHQARIFAKRNWGPSPFE